MGYYTNYEINATGFDDEEQAEFFEFKFKKKFKYGTTHVANDIFIYAAYEVKWYSWEQDLKEFSRSFPTIIIEVNGKGEEIYDIWKARILNGESEIIKTEIVYPEFKKITKDN